jgi:hypothetical protein
LSSDNQITHLQHDYRRDKGLSYLLCAVLQWLNGPSRVFYTKCVRSTPTSLSTALSRKMVIDLKLGISWERRYDVLFHFDGSLTYCWHIAQTVRHVDMLGDVKISESGQKDELTLEGADIENVSQSGALVN